MSDQIAELRELIEAYRLKSKSAFFKPIVAAYADAADELEAKLIRESRACPTDTVKSADAEIFANYREVDSLVRGANAWEIEKLFYHLA